MYRTLTAPLTLAASLALTASTSAAFASPAADMQLTPAQIASDIALAEESYSRVHPGYERYAEKADLDAAWNAIAEKAKAQNGMTVGEFYLAVQKVLTLIRCDHTKAELPATLREERNDIAVYLPMRWQVVEGRGFVTIAKEKSGLKTKDEILEIDGRPLTEMMAEVAEYIPYDGKTVWSRNSGVSESLEFMGGAVDHFGALLWDIKPQAKLKIRGVDGEERMVTVNRTTYNGWKRLGDAKAGVRNFKDAVKYQRVGENAGYLKIATFVNYREPVKPDTLYDPIFKSLKEEGRDSLILDLRQNGGGSSDASSRLLAHLIEKPTVTKRDMRVKTLNLDGIRQYLWTWDKRALKPNRLGFTKNDDGSYSVRSFVDEALRPVKPDSTAFTGKLIVLTSNNNSSGSTNILSLLEQQKRTILVGEKTGGSAEGPTAGILFTLTLPESKIRTRVPFIRYYNNIKSFEPGLGVSPDVEAKMTAKALLADEDPALQTALAIINDE